jgi:hypothetical protein
VPTEPVSLPSVAPSTAINQMLQALKETRSYRVDTSDVQNGHSVETDTIEVEMPDRSHVVVVALGMTHEDIYVGRDDYKKAEDGTWSKYKDDDNLNVAGAFLSGVQGKTRDLRFVGQETLDNVQTAAYEITFDMAKPSTVATQTVWISIPDNLPRRSVVHIISSVATSEGTKKDIETTVTSRYYDYNTNIKIEPPKMP